MTAPTLVDTERPLMGAGNGLLAKDESNPTLNKRFAPLGITQTEETRRTWREIIVTTPRLSDSISGASLCDETIRQQTKDGRSGIRTDD